MPKKAKKSKLSPAMIVVAAVVVIVAILGYFSQYMSNPKEKSLSLYAQYPTAPSSYPGGDTAYWNDKCSRCDDYSMCGTPEVTVSFNIDESMFNVNQISSISCNFFVDGNKVHPPTTDDLGNPNLLRAGYNVLKSLNYDLRFDRQHSIEICCNNVCETQSLQPMC